MMLNNYAKAFQRGKRNRKEADGLSYIDNHIRQAEFMLDSTSMSQIKKAEEIINYWGRTNILQ